MSTAIFRRSPSAAVCLGMGIEHQFLRHVIAKRLEDRTLTGRIIETPRNIPVRNIYRDHGFVEVEPGLWRLTR